MKSAFRYGIRREIERERDERGPSGAEGRGRSTGVTGVGTRGELRRKRDILSLVTSDTAPCNN